MTVILDERVVAFKVCEQYDYISVYMQAFAQNFGEKEVYLFSYVCPVMHVSLLL